jgi:ferredoxin-like protein FixX
MRRDGIFIAVEVDDGAAADRELAHALTDACPVDIYAQHENGTLEIVQENLDECVLCRLCLDAAFSAAGGPGAVKVIKLYDDDAVLS